MADQLVMGDLSRYNQAVQGYMRNGLSRQAAERQAGWDMARDLTQTAVQGGVRGIAFSAGGMAYGSGRQRSRGSYDVNDMAARAANGQIAGDGASRVDPSFTDTDLALAEILQEDAPRKPFTDEVQGGRIELEPDTKPDNSNSDNSFILRGTQYSPEYAQKLTDTHKTFKDNGYEASEHALNRIFGRINQGKIKSIEQVVDVLKTGTTYEDTLNGGLIKFKDRVAIAISDDGVIKTVIGEAKVKPSWEEVK